MKTEAAKDREEPGERAGDAVLVASDEERAERARDERGDQPHADVAGLDRDALAPLRQPEDGDLRRERQLHHERERARVGNEALALRTRRGKGQREDGRERERGQGQMARGEDEMPVGFPAEAQELREQMDADPAQHGERAER